MLGFDLDLPFGLVMQHVSAGVDVAVWVLILLCVGLMCIIW